MRGGQGVYTYKCKGNMYICKVADGPLCDFLCIATSLATSLNDVEHCAISANQLLNE